MAVYLNEDQAGVDGAQVGFPNLLLCTGVVLQTKAFLYGFHFTASQHTAETAPVFRGFIESRGGNVANAIALYGCSNWHTKYEGSKSDFQQEMRQIAGALGYDGVIWGFDTSVIPATNLRDGRYVEYHRVNGQPQCRIFYKAHDNTDFDTQNVIGREMARRPWGKLAAYNIGYGHAVGATPISTPGTAIAGLTELNYQTRLKKFHT
jgi:hypothetical protein